MGKILVTGFEPFAGDTVNPSAKLVEALGVEPEFRDLIASRVLPVSFDRAFPALKSTLSSGSDFSGVLMFGLANTRAKISLERVALNWTESRIPDEDGNQPVMGRMMADADEAIFSRLPLEKWRAEIEAAGIPCEVSLTAGGFVCNNLYFQTARLFQDSALKCLFVHVPSLPEQGTPERPSMEFAKMLTAARILVRGFASQHP
jgi:pyroglutamyl-peptidase